MSPVANTILTLPDVLEMMHGAVKEQGSAAALAAELGLSRSYVGDVLLNRREPGDRILAHLGLEKQVERVVTYRVKRGTR